MLDYKEALAALPELDVVYINTIAWVARVEVPSGGVPSKSVTKAMLNEGWVPLGHATAGPRNDVVQTMLKYE